MMAGAQGWLVALVLWLATVAGAYWAGDHNRNNDWIARATEQSRREAKLWRDEVARSGAAENKYMASAAALRNSYETLEGQFNALKLRGPIVVFRDRCGGLPAGDAGDAGGTLALPGGGLPGGQEVAGSADAAVGLSLGAVWMWNSALFGGDSAAGACSAADTASAACATDAGLGLADAWANHAANAWSCAADRQRFEQLIDYLGALP